VSSAEYKKEWGLVAILDALGAANYSDQEIKTFLRSREVILGLLNEKAETILGEIKKARLSTFTFNDTILIVYRTERITTARDVKRFATLLRKFIVDSLVQGILFRGSVAIGSFYVNEETNTVMGSAVTDAAAWYDRADWIGIHATPHASIMIESFLDYDAEALEHVILDYDVPLKNATAVPLKVVNWPKGFFVSGVTPCLEGQDQRAKLRELLAEHRVPLGTESKYFNTITLFEVVARTREAKKKAKKPATKSKAKNSKRPKSA
jgi:hypothetical protein